LTSTDVFIDWRRRQMAVIPYSWPFPGTIR